MDCYDERLKIDNRIEEIIEQKYHTTGSNP